MDLLKITVVASLVTLTGVAANAAPANGSNAAACAPQKINAAPPGKGGWPAASPVSSDCATVRTAACAKPEKIAGFNGKYGFRVAATTGADCSGKTQAAR